MRASSRVFFVKMEIVVAKIVYRRNHRTVFLGVEEVGGWKALVRIQRLCRH